MTYDSIFRPGRFRYLIGGVKTPPYESYVVGLTVYYGVDALFTSSASGSPDTYNNRT